MSGLVEDWEGTARSTRSLSPINALWPLQQFQKPTVTLSGDRRHHMTSLPAKSLDESDFILASNAVTDSSIREKERQVYCDGWALAGFPSRLPPGSWDVLTERIGTSEREQGGRGRGRWKDPFKFIALRNSFSKMGLTENHF